MPRRPMAAFASASTPLVSVVMATYNSQRSCVKGMKDVKGMKWEGHEAGRA
jgi:hypothetical protein